MNAGGPAWPTHQSPQQQQRLQQGASGRRTPASLARSGAEISGCEGPEPATSRSASWRAASKNWEPRSSSSCAGRGASSNDRFDRCVIDRPAGQLISWSCRIDRSIGHLQLDELGARAREALVVAVDLQHLGLELLQLSLRQPTSRAPADRAPALPGSVANCALHQRALLTSSSSKLMTLLKTERGAMAKPAFSTCSAQQVDVRAKRFKALPAS